MGEAAIRTCGVRFGKRDKELRGLVNLVRKEGAVLSAYCSLAVQYFLKFERFIQIAKVVPDTSDEFYTVNLYLEPSIMKQLMEYMETHQVKSRSNMIRIILMKSIEVCKNEEPELTSEFDLMRSMTGEVPRVVVTEKPLPQETKEEKIEKPVIKQETVSENNHKTEVIEDTVEEDRDDTDGDDLLENFFPGIKGQMDRW